MKRPPILSNEVQRLIAIMASHMTRTFIMLITDDELKNRLGAHDTIFFVGQHHGRQEEIQEQVERLGFGRLYNVSATRWLHSDAATIRAEPIATAV